METTTPQTPRRLQGSITSLVLDTFRKKNYWNVYHCKTCSVFSLGKDLHKNGSGLYVCLKCANPVLDVTDAPLGKAFIQMVVPQLTANR